jgi:predicted dithiol-disulfide oxidoreductase (DUF899 family)
MNDNSLPPAAELARNNPVRIPNESAEYRAARTALLAEEINLRRHIERVAEQRRALPTGAEVSGEYKFVGEEGEVDLAGLFGDKDTLVVYSFMYGPDMKRPCPMCTNAIGPWDAVALDLDQKVSFVVVARSPVERLEAWKQERGWRNIRLYSDANDKYSHDWFAVSPEGDDIPALSVFTKRDGIVRHFWSGEMAGPTADPGQDPRGAPDASPMWTIFDLTPHGRDPQWYPRLDYAPEPAPQLVSIT